MEKLIFQDENGKPVDFCILEQTRVNGKNYLLVADAEEGDGECLILKDTAGDSDQESLYEIVEEEQELDALLGVFGQLLDDVEIRK